MNSPPTPTNQAVTAANVDLSNCDRELVQYSGAVQPHAVLVAVSNPGLTITQVSVNAAELFGIEATALLGQGLATVLGEHQADAIRHRIAREVLEGSAPVHVVRTTIGVRRFNVFAHQIDGVFVLEFEVANFDLPAVDLYSEVRATLSRLQNTPNLKAFFELAVNEIRRLTGFDRVMAYEFLPDGSGHVTAESVLDGLEPYLGLHYPASDVPQPARRLFALTWLRHLPNVDYTPVPLIPELNPVTNAALDLSLVASRHVSVMYSKYLQNMGVKSTMVMTLLKNGALWGLISCMNHEKPQHVSYEVRMGCEFLAHMVSLLMGAKEDAEVLEYKLKLNAVMDQLIQSAARARTISDGLAHRSPNLLSAVQAHGAAILIEGRVTSLGATPGDDEIRELGKWLVDRGDPMFATENLGSVYSPGAAFAKTASGLLSARLSRSGCDFMMWFRPETVETVKWAGDPNKPVETQNLGSETRLMPRSSFALWKEEVRGSSTPWREFEIEAVRGLRHALMDMVVDRAEELARINRDLEKSNLELDSFAYVASHDLKEPLRGIHNYSALLQRSAGDRLSETEKSRLETVLRLTRRMDDLIESLLQYSRVGRIDLALEPMDLNVVARGAIDMLHARIEESGVSITVHQLPVVACDRVRVREVFFNLISNALKYNDSNPKQIEIGYMPGPEPTYYVKDNGIGIDPEFGEEIFKIFKRLHSREEYGGGTGAGLTIARKTVERHGGRIWVESAPGRGSTFYFTLGQASPGPRTEVAS